MDAGDGVPARLRETTRASLDESDALRARWHGAADGRMRYAYAPRFVLSCTEELLREVGARVQRGARLHTHAVRAAGRDRAGAPASAAPTTSPTSSRSGLPARSAALAHCVHATADERDAAGRAAARTSCTARRRTSSWAAASRPSPSCSPQGVHVALGADGAPCNNNLDGFVELRLAALLHKPRAGATAMPAATVLELATLGGARALGARAASSARSSSASAPT